MGFYSKGCGQGADREGQSYAEEGVLQLSPVVIYFSMINPTLALIAGHQLQLLTTNVPVPATPTHFFAAGGNSAQPLARCV